MNEKPLVSVLMTVFNREKYITEAIESVQASTYTNFELIIVDDCSVDKSVEIAKAYQQIDKRVKVYINEKNLGDYPNRSKATSYAKGDLLMFVDSDDSINPDALEYVVQSFQKFPDAKHSTIYYSKDITEPMLIQPAEAVYKHFYVNNMLSCGPGARVFKRAFYYEMGEYPIVYGPANDMYFNIKTSSNAAILCLPNIYLNYRIHELQENKNAYSYLYNGYRYFNDVMKLKEIPLTDKDRKLLILKSKRRFIVNTMKYFFKTFRLRKTINAYQLAGFTLKDILLGIFH